jgi:V8-like Glu-specific endopeptidase
MNIPIILNILFLNLAAQASFLPNYIVGGEDVDPRDPIQSSTIGIFSPSPNSHSGALCTGTLIRKDIALTAAHCIQPRSKPILIFNRDLHDPTAAKQQAEAVVTNPKWQKRAGRGMDQGDIALIKFNGHLPEGYKKVSTARVDSDIHAGERVTLAGYGISDAATKVGAGRLRKTQVRVLNSRPGKSEMILDQSHGHGACHGDSGGPAFINKNGKMILAGVTNRGYPNHAPDDCVHRVVYTKVPAYRSWIAKSEKKLEARPPLLRTTTRMKNHKLSTRKSHVRHKRHKPGSRHLRRQR